MFMLAWDEGGNVIASCDQLIGLDDEGKRGWVDTAAHEMSGQRMRRLWNVNGAVGSGSWPEYLGGRAHEFRVEVSPDRSLPLIRRLVHRESGYVRDREAIEARLAAGESRSVVCGKPDEPLRMDSNGC